ASRESIEEAARILASASSPVIWAGGGAISSRASSALEALAEYLQAPVIMTGEGKGAISDRHYLSMGSLRFRNDPFRERLSKSDVVLAVGTRLAFPELLDGQQVIQIDIDEREIGRNYKNTLGVIGDARRSLEGLLSTLRTLTPSKASREQELEAVREEKRSHPSANIEPLSGFLKAMRAAIPDDGIFVAGMTQLGYYSRAHYPVYEPGTFYTSSYYGNLGYAFPVALGAKVARPDKAVVAVSGDGGFMYNVQELSTAARYGINVVVVVFNDNAYGNVLRDQKTRYNGRAYGSELLNPDFMKLADAFGVRGVRVHDAPQLEAAMKDAIARNNAPTLIEVPVGEMPYPY
ncbi:MAG: thiamine pyrophosphate-dependent enzyme, partial [Chloroflexi bacterium]|nr:thiamine pyrophosphate-dependent enzyme [Chloroflexota bacterium]